MIIKFLGISAALLSDIKLYYVSHLELVSHTCTLTIVGHVNFCRNKGFQGGALMLIGTVMNIAREANLLFHENSAENTGGAIFVVHPQMMINLHGFHSSCFY